MSGETSPSPSAFQPHASAAAKKPKATNMGRRKSKPSKKPSFASVDEIFEAVGPWGPYQWTMCAIYGWHFTLVSINDGFMSFAAMRPQLLCLDQGANNTPTPDKEEFCAAFENCTNKSFVSPFHTIVEDYSLVCGLDWVPGFITSLQFFGIMIGAVLSGPVVDALGRKWTFLVFVAMEILLGCLVTLAPNWQIHAAFRMAIGFFAGADMNAGWVFLGEFTTNKYRFLFRSLSLIVPKFAYPLIGYITKDWIGLELVGNLVCAPLVFVVPLLCHESPRWLIQQGRTTEALQVLKAVARRNGAAELSICEEDLPSVPKSPQRFPPVQKLFDTRASALSTLVATVTWFYASHVNYGIFFDLGNLGFDVYVTQSVLSLFYVLFELPFSYADMKWPGMNRRWLILGFTALAVACCALIAVLYFAGYSGGLILTLIAIVGHSAIWLVFDLAYVLATELFPTALRSSAGSLCSCAARLGSLAAPPLIDLQTRCSSCDAIPYVAFACVGTVGLVVNFFLLPNTKQLALLEGTDEELFNGQGAGHDDLEMESAKH